MHNSNLLSIVGWEATQHYRNRTPPWVKLHNSLLDDPRWGRLSDEDKATYVVLLLLASRTANQIPADPEWIQRLGGLHRTPNLQGLVDAGFVEVASGVLAPRLHDACAEERRGEREQRESRRESAATAAQPARAREPSLEAQHGESAPSEPASPRSRVAAFPETSDTGSTSEPSEAARSMAGLPEALESKRRGPPNRRGKEAPPTLARCLEILRAEHPLLQAVAGLPEALAEWYAALAETRGKKTWATERAWRLMLRRLESDPGHAVRAVQKATEGSAAGPWLGIEAALEHVHRSGNGTYAASHASSRRNGYEKPRTGKW